MGPFDWKASLGMNMFLAQCPHCKTIFQTDFSLLGIHGGMVMCGECRHPFNAFDHPYQFHVEQSGSVTSEPVFSSFPEVKTPLADTEKQPETLSSHEEKCDPQETMPSTSTDGHFVPPSLDLLLTEPDGDVKLCKTASFMDDLTAPVNIVPPMPASTAGIKYEPIIAESPDVVDTVPVDSGDNKINLEKGSSPSSSAEQPSPPMSAEAVAPILPVNGTITPDAAKTTKSSPDTILPEEDSSDEIEDILSLLKNKGGATPVTQHADLSATFSVPTEITPQRQNDLKTSDSFGVIKGNGLDETEVTAATDCPSASILPTGQKSISKDKRLLWLCIFLSVLLLVQVWFFFGNTILALLGF